MKNIKEAISWTDFEKIDTTNWYHYRCKTF